MHKECNLIKTNIMKTWDFLVQASFGLGLVIHPTTNFSKFNHGISTNTNKTIEINVQNTITARYMIT